MARDAAITPDFIRLRPLRVTQRAEPFRLTSEHYFRRIRPAASGQLEPAKPPLRIVGSATQAGPASADERSRPAVPLAGKRNNAVTFRLTGEVPATNAAAPEPSPGLLPPGPPPNANAEVSVLPPAPKASRWRTGGRIAYRLVSLALLGAVASVFLLVAAGTAPVLFGYHSYVVYGGSMGHGLPAGSVAVSRPTSVDNLKVGDTIARRDQAGTVVLHRIVDIKPSGSQRLFVTKGDANASPDPDPATLLGEGDRVVYHVPYAGYILHYVGGGLGRLSLVGVSLAGLAAILLSTRLRTRRQSPVFVTAGSGELPARYPEPESADNEYRRAA